jgi:hypothetical protein
MSVKTSFFEVMSGVKKDSKDISAGIGILKKIKLLYKFSRNMRSKLARSTLTLPGPIRVNTYFYYLFPFGSTFFSFRFAMGAGVTLSSWTMSHLSTF